MQIDGPYETVGTLFFIDMIKGMRGIIALSFDDYVELLSRGFRDEEIYLTITKAKYGIEYARHVPTYKLCADLCTIRMDGQPKYQLLIDTKGVKELKARGFIDNEKVSLVIEVSPSRRPAIPLEPDGIKIDF